MRAVVDRLILIAVCSFFLVMDDSFYKALITFLISVAIEAFMVAMDRKSFSIGCCLAFLILAFLSDYQFYAFLPLACYEMMFSLASFNNQRIKITGSFYVALGYMILSCIMMLIMSAPSMDKRFIYLLLVLLPCSCYFSIRTRLSVEADRELEEQQNMNLGEKLLTQKRQKDFLLQKDSEVHLATLKERNRIAREIHDNVGHMLSRALLVTGAIKTVNKDAALIEPLNNLQSTLSEAMESVRESVHDLYDESIDLNATIEAVVKEFDFCPVELDLDSGRYMTKEIKYCIISILKEALSNTARHSNATLVKVTLRSHPSRYQLLIEDNGSVSINSDGTGIGLESMKERTNSLGGTIYISNEKGFRIFVTLPAGNE